jgi:hypothetical protein
MGHNWISTCTQPHLGEALLLRAGGARSPRTGGGGGVASLASLASLALLPARAGVTLAALVVAAAPGAVHLDGRRRRRAAGSHRAKPNGGERVQQVRVGLL